MQLKTARHIRSIAKEFGEPFDDVVKGFGELGYSRGLVSQVLELDRTTLRNLCRERGLDKHFKTQNLMRRECRKESFYSDAEILAEVLKYPTVKLFRAHGKMSEMPIRNRFGRFSTALKLARGEEGY